MGGDYPSVAAWLAGFNDPDRIRRDKNIGRSLDTIVQIVENLYYKRNDVNDRLRELKSTFSALERAMDNRVRELQQKAGGPSGFSSYSYAEYDIKSEWRKIDRLIERIGRGCNDLFTTQQQLKSESEVARANFKRLQESNDSLIGSLKPLMLGMAAMSGGRTSSHISESRNEDERVNEVRKSCERQLAELTDSYEKKLAALKASSNASAELSELRTLLDAERTKNKLLSDELSHEKQCNENYKVALKRQTSAFSMLHVLNRTRRFIIKWYFWIAAVFIIICFTIVALGLFS